MGPGVGGDVAPRLGGCACWQVFAEEAMNADRSVIILRANYEWWRKVVVLAI